MPPYTMIGLSFVAYRVHSIFVLRLFNDPLAMLLLYASVYLFMQRRWTFGCTLFRCVAKLFLYYDYDYN